jgi:hypothetical protein
LEELTNMKHMLYSKGLLMFNGQIKHSNSYFALLLDFRSAEGSSVTHIFLKDLRVLHMSDPKAESIKSLILDSDTADSTMFLIQENYLKSI